MVRGTLCDSVQGELPRRLIKNNPRRLQVHTCSTKPRYPLLLLAVPRTHVYVCYVIAHLHAAMPVDFRRVVETPLTFVLYPLQGERLLPCLGIICQHRASYHRYGAKPNITQVLSMTMLRLH